MQRERFQGQYVLRYAQLGAAASSTSSSFVTTDNVTSSDLNNGTGGSSSSSSSLKINSRLQQQGHNKNSRHSSSIKSEIFWLSVNERGGDSYLCVLVISNQMLKNQKILVSNIDLVLRIEFIDIFQMSVGLGLMLLQKIFKSYERY